jgi:hypothetical protein
MRLRARAAVLVVVAGFMLASPAHRVFGGRSPYLRDWMLYRDVGVGLIEARFVRRDAQGEHAVDRFAALGVQRASAPRSLTHLQGEAGLHRVLGGARAR